MPNQQYVPVVAYRAVRKAVVAVAGPGLTTLCACAGLDDLEAVLEFRLGAMELGEGGGEVLELLVELLLDLGELFGREGVEIDYGKKLSAVALMKSRWGICWVISLVSCWPDILLFVRAWRCGLERAGMFVGFGSLLWHLRFGGVEMPEYSGCSR
jgi:hypothetical protein